MELDDDVRDFIFGSGAVQPLQDGAMRTAMWQENVTSKSTNVEANFPDIQCLC